MKTLTRAGAISWFLLGIMSTSAAVSARSVPKAWRGELATVHDLLLVEKNKAALRRVSSLIERVGAFPMQGDEVGHTLALALTLKAVALHRQSERDAAAWSWDSAQVISPNIRLLDLEAYGASGRALRDLLPGAERFPRPRSDKGWDPELGIEKPVRVYTKHVSYPGGARRRQIQGSVRVRARVSEEGLLQAPEVVELNGPITFLCAALDAMGQWRYRPARRDGQPVAVWHELTIGYHLQ